MAYVKTNWVDNTTPIDKNNLNKIEQGIYNNSLVVDAVTNTINPTDTTTYKTAELTEGQITDVIGVNDIVIKGQTEQDGEPTPSSPVDVNVVSGSNVINTSNKNLFDVKNYVSTFQEGLLTMKKIDSNNFTLFGAGDSKFCLIFLGKVKNLKGKSLYFKCTTSKNLDRNYAVVSCNSSGENRNDIFSLNFNGNVLSGTGTIGNNIDENLYVAVRLYATGSAFPDSVTYTNVQVHYGTTATTYEPHQGKELPLDLGTIELCKIENYQDYFYKSGSKWYLHKEIKKIRIDGSENWSFNFNSSMFRVPINDIKPRVSSPSNLIKSNYFTNQNYGEMYESTLDNGIEVGDSSALYIYVRNKDITKVVDFKTWLASNNVLLYYVLATATDTEITDTTLISQLEAIYNAPLYEQTNITQTNNDLPMILDITACKDNINGIKAFIRK